MPNQNHDAGIARMEKLKSEVGEGRNGEPRQRDCDAGLQSGSLSQHEGQRQCWHDPKDRGGLQAIPVRADG
jgi:hypothetical protein